MGSYNPHGAQAKPKLREVHEKNQIEIFSVLVILLGLDDTERSRGLFSRTHRFSFDVKTAIAAMNCLSLAIELTAVTSTVSYSIKPEMAYGLLRRWFAAHMLHCPISRTESVLKETMNVQVTPKGTALVYGFCKNIGLRPDNMPPIVRSPFNSVRLFAFDRSPTRNRVLYSTYLLYVLVSQMMGPAPNVWTSRQAPAPVPNLFADDKVDFTFSEVDLGVDYSAELLLLLDDSVRVSPFHHKYFTNPASDAHIQYYESRSGLRVFHNKVFGNGQREVRVEYSFTGKAVCQWLLDCTMLLSVSEAVEVGDLLVRHGLFIGVTVAASGRFSVDRDAYYILSDSGEQACRWRSSMDGAVSLGSMDEDNSLEEDIKAVSLKKVLQDPGIRYLFRLHMEKERCAENLSAYLQLVDFMKLKTQLAQLLRMHARMDGPKKERLAQIIDNQASVCYSTAFHLYLTYLSEESQYDVNIDFALREEVRLVMLNIRGDTPRVDYMKTPVVERYEWVGLDQEGSSVGGAKEAGNSGNSRNSTNSGHSSTEAATNQSHAKTRQKDRGIGIVCPGSSDYIALSEGTGDNKMLQNIRMLEAVELTLESKATLESKVEPKVESGPGTKASLDVTDAKSETSNVSNAPNNSIPLSHCSLESGPKSTSNSKPNSKPDSEVSLGPNSVGSAQVVGIADNTSKLGLRVLPETESQAVSARMLAADTMAALSRIYRVFGKIASSIYRLMEVDSYPKFVRSDEYMYAVGIERRA